ncbi:MAG: hypothetical protein IK025_03130 [Bacteroidales bacterium]|nr:hypothetical protein [Bacteroidales bacterium]
MNKETFAKYINNPSLLDNDSLPEIKAMLDEFPYFQSAWVLYIKNLHATKDIRYESKLKTACAYISDRKHLHDILKGNYSIVQAQFIASQTEKTLEENAIVQTQNIASKTEETIEENPIVQTQGLASQPEIIDTDITESSNLQIFESLNPEPEEPETQKLETRNIETEEPESSNLQIFESSNPEPVEPENQKLETRNIETEEPESSNFQIFESSNPETEKPETRNIETEVPESSNYQIIKSSNLDPDKPESLADRILRQAEEMRRAKAAAQAEINAETQGLASQQKENAEDNTIVQTQNIASQSEEIAEENPIVQTQFIASQPEIQDTEIPESSNNQIFELSNLETEEPESSNLQPLARRSQIIESSNQDPQKLETRNIETPKPETINAIDQSQIRELIEKQLHSLGITANITFSGNRANIQFENLATDEKPNQNPTDLPIVEKEAPLEIHPTPNIEEQIEKRKNDRNKKANLIDKFIESKARIVPKKDYHSDNKLSTESIIEDEELFTEQLAKIYIKQGHLEKALETYEKLYLKYPEKNIYFATRIEYVKRLMNK